MLLHVYIQTCTCLTFFNGVIPPFGPVLQTLGIFFLNVTPFLDELYEFIGQLIAIVHALDRPPELTDLPETP